MTTNLPKVVARKWPHSCGLSPELLALQAPRLPQDTSLARYHFFCGHLRQGRPLELPLALAFICPKL